MKYCSVKSCKSSDLDKDISLHKVKEAWQKDIQWKKDVGSLICSCHFEKNNYVSKHKKRLKKDAFPTIFYPSKDTIQICKISERKMMEARMNSTFFSKPSILQYLVTKTTSCILTQFPNIFERCDEDPNHKYRVIYRIHSKDLVTLDLTIFKV